jgi:hypothetical protein
MSSSPATPWYNVPARAFPAKRWLEKRYPFRVSPLLFLPPLARQVGAASARREFPAKRWLEAGSGLAVK